MQKLRGKRKQRGKAEREREKERLKLAAAAQEEEGQSPSKMVESSAVDDVQMPDANGDDGSSLGVMANGHGNGVSDDAGDQIVSGSSLFGSHQLTSQSQVCPPTESVSPTQTRPYQPTPAHTSDGLVPPSYNPYPSHINQPMEPIQPYPFIHGIQQQHPFSGPYQSTQSSFGIYPHTYANNPTLTSHYRPNPPQSVDPLPVLNHPMSPPTTGHHLQPGNQLYQPRHVPGPYGVLHPHATSTASASKQSGSWARSWLQSSIQCPIHFLPKKRSRTCRPRNVPA